MSNLPMVSIITPSYNQGQFIERTILSVLNQTYVNVEYIIIDGESTDNTIQILEKYRNKISKIIIEKDRGQADALNKGFKMAKGELVGWINSDDILSPNCVEEIIKLSKIDIDSVIFYSEKLKFINSKDDIIEIKSNWIPDKKHLLNDNYNVSQPASFYRNEVLHKVNYLNTNLNYCMDLDLWLRLLNYGYISAYKGEPLGSFRLWEDSKTNTGGINFLREIRHTLLSHGAAICSKNIIRTYLYSVKLKLKLFFK